MTKAELEKDKKQLQERIEKAARQLQILQAQILRYQGALAYIEDNLKKEVGEDVGK